MYDIIIVGAGAAGLFTGCHLNKDIKSLILEKKSKPGIKLMMSGAGQCNLTHGGSVKDFLDHYGQKGKLVRQILYKYNNEMTIRFFEDRGLKIIEREDGKVFPLSLDSKDIVDFLIKKCKENSVDIRYNAEVTKINAKKDNTFEVVTENETYMTKYLVIASGGCSYPSTGSDGSIFRILKEIGVNITELNPALTPVFLEDYPYGELSGISFENCGIEVYDKSRKVISIKDDVLFTHQNISGPGILNSARYMKKGNTIRLNYLGMDPSVLHSQLREKLNQAGNMQISTFLREYFKIPKRFVEIILAQLQIDAVKKASHISKTELNTIINKLTSDQMTIKSLGSFNIAMATSGGVALSDVNMNTLSSNQYSHLFFAGEVLDVDGDTGGYNIQFAFSSGYLCAKGIKSKLTLAG